jgi:hypothetical protein
LNTLSPLLRFCWPNKSGPQCDVETLEPSLIRPYPTARTAILDDKILIWELLKGTTVVPDVIESPEDAVDGELYFVKHRLGAQGKSVYVYDRKELMEWSKRSQNVHDFVIQREVITSLDDQGRKFVLRNATCRRYLFCSPGNGSLGPG